MKTNGFQNFGEFYPYYLSEHRNRTCKILHFLGTGLVLLTLAWVIMQGEWTKMWIVPLAGYGFAWLGHFGFEKNRPATFKYPFYSLTGDFVMFYHLLTGKLSFESGAKLASQAD